MTFSTDNHRGTVGIAFPGEMGAAVGRLLVAAGRRVVTTLEGRSARTAALCRDAGLDVLGTFGELVRSADVFISLVPPAAALDVAGRYAAEIGDQAESAVFVDANSISPSAVRRIASLVAARGVDVVDVAIHGLAARLADQGTLYLSGPRAGDVEDLFSGALRIKRLGDEIGAASAFKMLMAGMSKGFVGLFVEMAMVASEMGVLDELLAAYREYYPGIVSVVDRLLPTYPRHARRRADELGELEETIESLGLEPRMICGARRNIAAIGRLALAERFHEQEQSGWSVADVLAKLHAQNPLRRLQTV